MNLLVRVVISLFYFRATFLYSLFWFPLFFYQFFIKLYIFKYFNTNSIYFYLNVLSIRHISSTIDASYLQDIAGLATVYICIYYDWGIILYKYLLIIMIIIMIIITIIHPFLLWRPSLLYQNPKSKHSKSAKQTENNIWKYIRKRLPKSQRIRRRKWKYKITTLDFNKIWINTYFSYNQSYAKDLLYKFLHYAIKRNNFVFNISRDKTDLSPNCDHCQMTEDNIHLFTTCNRVKKIWTYFQPTYKKLSKMKTYTPTTHSHTKRQ